MRLPADPLLFLDLNVPGSEGAKSAQAHEYKDREHPRGEYFAHNTLVKMFTDMNTRKATVSRNCVGVLAVIC